MTWEKDEIKKSWPCNGELLKYLREKKGWTQKQLAEKSGYSERLVSKAEGGRPISSSAIEILAETLSCDQETWVAGDLTCNPMSLAKRYIHSLYEEQANAFQSIRSMLHEECEFHVSGDPAIIPFAGIHRGLTGIERAFEILFSVLEVPKGHDYRPWYTFSAFGNEAIVWGKTWIHPIGSPFEQPMDIQNRFVFQAGKLILFEDRFDTHRGHESFKNRG